MMTWYVGVGVIFHETRNTVSMTAHVQIVLRE